MGYDGDVVFGQELDGFCYVFVIFKFDCIVVGFFYDLGGVVKGDVWVFFVGVKGYIYYDQCVLCVVNNGFVVYDYQVQWYVNCVFYVVYNYVKVVIYQNEIGVFVDDCCCVCVIGCQ